MSGDEDNFSVTGLNKLQDPKILKIDVKLGIVQDKSSPLVRYELEGHHADRAFLIRKLLMLNIGFEVKKGRLINPLFSYLITIKRITVRDSSFYFVRELLRCKYAELLAYTNYRDIPPPNIVRGIKKVRQEIKGLKNLIIQICGSQES